jgi:hypothetical protein
LLCTSYGKEKSYLVSSSAHCAGKSENSSRWLKKNTILCLNVT